MLDQLALFLGLFVPPLAVLSLGHGYRRRGSGERGMFWGGVLGFLAGTLVVLFASLSPPVWWGDGRPLRALAVHWSLAVCVIIGVLIGWMVKRSTP